ncbi:MAG: hypothetical protein DHS20C20_05240 [Ardenticatenaceae bacterium]|nr:MAG: hypothetical protein DHS20C20_05240 [Ardenticatenaceae bacterium]
MKPEVELIAPVDLCLPNGRLNPAAVGWSRTPLHRANLNGRWPRKKRWNYWAVTTETHLFSVTITDLDYAGLVFVYFADFAARQLTEVTRIIPLGRGCNLPELVAADLHYHSANDQVAMQQTGDGVQLSVAMADFDGRPLTAQFAITMPPQHETLNVVVPWNERTFQFTSKQNTLPAEGVVTLGGEATHFAGPQSFACLDYGRGIWPRDCRWNWGSASGMENGRTVGLNLGGQWTDNTGSTENGVCVDGRLHKISEDLTWQYDKTDFMRPWHITAPSGALDLTFTPFMERVAASNLWLIRSEVHQLFGHYSGQIAIAAGEIVPVQNLVGWAEDHVARW